MRLSKIWVALLLLPPISGAAQNANERTFPLPLSTVQAAIKKLPGGASGALPVLDGFVVPSGRSLQSYRRPYYQCSIRSSAGPSGGSVVHVSAKITAWNSDPAHPGYEVLPSNGRIETDLLDRLQDFLGGNSSMKAPAAGAAIAGDSSPVLTSTTPQISAPMPQMPHVSSVPSANHSGDEDQGLKDQARGLEELLKNQSRPTDLLAVREDQTPILQEPSADAKVLFLASAEDEFEVLDTNPEWVHVRISGLSRGWVRRSSVQILDGSEPAGVFGTAPPVVDRASAASSEPAPANSKLFSVSGEEEGSFPGEWAPLKGKSVKIISIQQAQGTGRITSPQDKMRFAENVFKSTTPEKTSAGLVLIFDAEDGGMIAAPRSVIDLWKTGALSEQAFWRQCYLDPPEILGSAN